MKIPSLLTVIFLSLFWQQFYPMAKPPVQSKEEKNYFLKLPKEILIEIFKRLANPSDRKESAKTIHAAMAVCKNFYKLLKSDQLYSYFIEKFLPVPAIDPIKDLIEAYTLLNSAQSRQVLYPMLDRYRIVSAALVHASRWGNCKIIKDLLPVYNNYPCIHTKNLLLYAIRKKNFPIVKILLEDERTNANQAYKYGETPLMLSIRKDSLPAMKMLLFHSKTNCLLTNDYEETIYDYARMKKDSSYSQLLLTHKQNCSCLRFTFKYPIDLPD